MCFEVFSLFFLSALRSTEFHTFKLSYTTKRKLESNYLQVSFALNRNEVHERKWVVCWNVDHNSLLQYYALLSHAIGRAC